MYMFFQYTAEPGHHWARFIGHYMYTNVTLGTDESVLFVEVFIEGFHCMCIHLLCHSDVNYYCPISFLPLPDIRG